MRTALTGNHTFRSIFRFNQLKRDDWMQRQSLTFKPGLRVLDVGAGSSPYRSLFSSMEFKTHDFCQLKPEQLLGQKGYAPIDYVSDIKRIPVPDESFDVIVCTEVLEHVPEPIAALKEIARICKPGGVVLVTAPLMSGLHQTPFHFYGGYTPYFYQKFLTEFGFDIDEISPNGHLFRLYGQESSRFIRRSAPWKIAAPWAVKVIWAPLWLLATPATLAAVFCGCVLDRYDGLKDFTVGYHVRATKRVSTAT